MGRVERTVEIGGRQETENGAESKAGSKRWIRTITGVGTEGGVAWIELKGG